MFHKVSRKSESLESTLHISTKLVKESHLLDMILGQNASIHRQFHGDRHTSDTFIKTLKTGVCRRPSCTGFERALARWASATRGLPGWPGSRAVFNKAYMWPLSKNLHTT